VGNKMKLLESYKKIAKSMLTEHAWDRKFGEPLPTLDDVMREASQDDEDYVHIGYGKYKDKDHVDDPTAPTFKKDDSGAFVPAKGEDKKQSKGGEEKPVDKSKGLEPGDFERDFGGDTGTDADFEGEPPEGAREPDDRYASYDDMTAMLDEPDDEEARAQAFKDMEDEFGDEDEEDMEEKIIIINGKKYKSIKDSIEPTIFDPKKHLLREMYERIGGK
jgi:hypothetical protein